ncbi:hypothetical protein NC651_014947 [Populus alba x Populus x berolinensis]|nr:hypothetical protein NC651_014947 [Populus alba x Populus x berolinensis]
MKNIWDMKAKVGGTMGFVSGNSRSPCVANDGGIYTHPEPIIPLHASGEGREATNDSRPLSIAGAGSKLCVSVNRLVPQLVDCKADTKEQKWEFYTDGTLRTETNLSMCLTCNDLTQGSDILVLPCNYSLPDYSLEI